MSSIKLKHTSGNGTILHGPAANPSGDITLKLPSNTGSAGQVLKVASANHSSTNAELEFASGGGSGNLQVLEQFYLLCDGRSVSTSNGTVSTTDVSGQQALTDSFAVISGSTITYQPPTGTTELIYEYRAIFAETSSSNRLLVNYELQIDSTTIEESRETYMNATSGYSHDLTVKYGFRVNTGGSDSSVTGDRAGLTSMAFRVRARRWDSSYAATMHRLTYWNGNSSSNINRRPYVGITAIGTPS